MRRRKKRGKGVLMRNFSIVISIMAVLNAANAADWLSVPNAPVFDGTVKDGSRAADGTSWFAASYENSLDIRRAQWTVTGLGVFDVFVNGRRVGDDFLKPGFTHYAKTKYSFTYDVTDMIRAKKGDVNFFAAEVSAGWWRDKIVTPAGRKGFVGRKSAFRGELELVYVDGTKRVLGTNPRDWKCGIAGPVTHAAIFDGEEYDARIATPYNGEGLDSVPEVNTEFKGELLPTAGAEICLRRDLAIQRGPFRMNAGERLVVDFGQNCAAVPEFCFKSKTGTVLTVLLGEMLNDADEGQRGCDGPKGSLYRANLRVPNDGMRLVYTFAGTGRETYLPRFTFFGYRYISITATDDVEIESITSIPVTSIRKDMEIGRIEVGDPSLNKFIQNVYWGQLSNYLSVPTDCPQRNERIGWTADTQVFAEAASFNADVYDFLCKWMRDMRDSQHVNGSFPCVAPFAQYGNGDHLLGWADAGVIVPYTMWKQFGDPRIVRENWAAMERFLAMQDATEYKTPKRIDGSSFFQCADWLSFEDYEPCNGSAYEIDSKGKRTARKDAVDYWNFLAGCYWYWDAKMMNEMAMAIGDLVSAKKYEAMAAKANGYIRSEFVDPVDGMLLGKFRHLQGAALFALKFGVLERPDAVAATCTALRRNFEKHNGCLQTGFLGTSILMDTLVENGMADVAYDVLLNHNFPGWLYSVDQGATTVWERWNSYTKDKGFGPVNMNSFNHYAYGGVLAWIYKTVAGIAADPKAPGFRNIIMSPVPDRRLGYITAEYKSAAGLIRSAWRYEGEKWIWEFAIPDGATAMVAIPGKNPELYVSGQYRVERNLGSL